MAEFLFKQFTEMTGREWFCVARLRINTFVCEQKITDPELDQQDLTAIQVFLLNQAQDEAVAVCRLFQEDGRWLVGRVAVDQRLRGQQLGTEMMVQVHQYLRAHKIKRLFCHAQLQAKPFYEALGYQTQGKVFVEAGVKHIMMSYAL